jgi:hypothetical protein
LPLVNRGDLLIVLVKDRLHGPAGKAGGTPGRGAIGFLDARTFPEISFRSELLVWVPAGWRAVGRLQVKDTEHDLACQLDLHYGETQPDGSRRVIIVSSWVIDSRWVTSRRIPGLGRRIVMTCPASLEPGM